MSTSVSSVAANLAAEKVPTINLIGYALAGDGLARVVVDVMHTRASREDHALVGQSLSKIFDNKLMAVCGSFQSVDKAPYSERVEGIVRVNTQSVAFQEGMSGFRSVSSNIFMDDEEKMWVLRKTEAGDLLVKGTGIEDHESLKGLLDVVCSSGYSLSSEYKKATAKLSAKQKAVVGGHFIAFVSNSSGEVNFGFVVASDEANDKLIVLPVGAEPESEGEVVDKVAVVESFNIEDFPEPEMSEQEQMDQAVCTARGVVNLSTLLAFYKKVFARSPAFYAEFAKRARAHAFM
jgi:hypothetical protein